MNPLFWLFKKELKSAYRSKWLMFGFVVGPLIAWGFQGVFLAYMFGQATGGGQTVYYTNDDLGPIGGDLINAIEGNATYLGIGELIEINATYGQKLVADGSVGIWIYIPENFTHLLLTYNTTTLKIYVDTSSTKATSVAKAIEYFSKNYINIVIRELQVEEIPVSKEATYGFQLAIFLVMLMSVVAPAPYVSQSFAGERERRTLEALLVVPMSRLKILTGKVLAGLVLTGVYAIFTIVGIEMYNGMIYLALGNMASYASYFTVSESIMPLIAFSQMLVALCALGIGVVISCLTKDQASAESINNLVLMIPTMAIGILSFTGSIESIGGIFGYLIAIIPFTHAVLFLNGVLLHTASVYQLLFNIAYLVISTLVFIVIGAKIFEREGIVS